MIEENSEKINLTEFKRLKTKRSEINLTSSVWLNEMWSFKRYGLVNERSQNGQQCCFFLSELCGDEKLDGMNEFSFVELVALLLLLLLFAIILTNLDEACWNFFVKLDESLLSLSSSSPLSFSRVFVLLKLKLASICKLSFCIWKHLGHSYVRVTTTKISN